MADDGDHILQALREKNIEDFDFFKELNVNESLLGEYRIYLSKKQTRKLCKR